MNSTNRWGWVFLKINAKLPLIAQILALIPLAYAQAATFNVQPILDTMWSLLAAIQAVIWVIIALAWMTGNLMWSAPTRSMIIKKAGSQQMELSGIAMFLTLMGPGLFAFIIFLARVFGVGSWGGVISSATMS